MGFTCCTEPYSPQPLPTAVTRTIIPTFSAYRAQKCATARPLLTVRSSQCVNLPSLAFSSTVLATMFSSSIKKEKILNAEVFGYTSVCSEKTTSFSLSAVRVCVCVCVFSSLLVGIRVNFTHIKVVEDKTGCHRFACNVSWAWFLLWAGSAALHFYSNPPKTIPCVIWLRNLPMQKISKFWRHRCTRTEGSPFFFPSVDPFQPYTRILPALHYNSRGWLSAPERTSARPPTPTPLSPPPCRCVIKKWAGPRCVKPTDTRTHPPEVEQQNKSICQ